MRIEINTDALKRDIGDLQMLIQSLRGQLKDLDGSMQSLNQTWEGIAKTAYMLEYQADHEALEQLLGIISDYINLLISARDEYVKGDESVKAAVAQIKI